MAKSKLVRTNAKIAEGVVEGYKAIENGVVGSYKKIEDGVVKSFTRLEDRFVDEFLTREGESVEDTKARIAGRRAEGDASATEAARQRAETLRTRTGTASDLGKASMEASLKTARAAVEAIRNVGKPR